MDILHTSPHEVQLSLDWGNGLKICTFVYTYIPVDCAQSSKASWETFEATALEKRCWNGTKARLGAAWWGDREERPPPSSTDEEKQGFIALKPQRPAFKGEDENSGVGFFFAFIRKWDMTGGRRGEAMHFKTTHIQDLSALTHTHTAIWFASRAPVETGTYIYPTNNTHILQLLDILHKVPHASSHTSLFLPAHRNELKGRVSVVWLKRALSAAFPISHSCVKAFFSSSPSLFFLFLGVERRK